jgi:indole-3-glycerol phosphate synthase
MALPNILEQILASKRCEVAAAREKVPLAELERRAASALPVRDFVGAIRARHALGKPAVIAEIKKASPSAGQFRGEPGEFDPPRFARSYEAHGAACLSVLTDRDYFHGSADDLVAARAACALPVLRKDFIVDPYQIVEARAMGADAVLFIIGCAPITLFREWERLASALGLAVLAESHTAAELDEALTLKTPLIGINNRDLTRFVTDIETTLRLMPRVGAERILITESGITDAVTVKRMQTSGVNTYLVGGAFMSTPDPGRALADIFGTQPS